LARETAAHDRRPERVECVCNRLDRLEDRDGRMARCAQVEDELARAARVRRGRCVGEVHDRFGVGEVERGVARLAGRLELYLRHATKVPQRRVPYTLATAAPVRSGRRNWPVAELADGLDRAALDARRLAVVGYHLLDHGVELL